ncbi:unnamed protein product [Nyctereutes procyonoides]|uniref:Nucleolar protein 10 n=1 Tax=Nyctereutes procyonoides TaxID=34880 RepID=A0A811ZIX0_NYCPR|nr:unnamed protein product [Nyctereutes procyonoides]
MCRQNWSFWLCFGRVSLYYLSEQGDQGYMLKKLDPVGQQTYLAHPAQFSPDDIYS